MVRKILSILAPAVALLALPATGFRAQASERASQRSFLARGCERVLKEISLLNYLRRPSTPEELSDILETDLETTEKILDQESFTVPHKLNFVLGPASTLPYFLIVYPLTRWAHRTDGWLVHFSNPVQTFWLSASITSFALDVTKSKIKALLAGAAITLVANLTAELIDSDGLRHPFDWTDFHLGLVGGVFAIPLGLLSHRWGQYRLIRMHKLGNDLELRKLQEKAKNENKNSRGSLNNYGYP